VLRYVLRRVLFSIPILIIASIIVFAAAKTSTSPLAGLRSNPRVTQHDLLEYKKTLGLDRPAHTQYLTWLGNFVRGRWGQSLISQRDVAPDITEALANTAVLAVTATAISLAIGVALGVLSATRQYSVFDYTATTVAFLGLSMPVFWFALILQIVFGLYLTNWLGLSEPIFFTAGMFRPGSFGFDLVDRLRHMALPVTVLCVQIIAVYSRYMRASMLEVLNSDYLRTARAKGVPERRVLVRHAMRNALIPLTTVVAIDLGALAGGLIVTETIFEWPGMGRLFVESMQRGDYAVVLPWMMVVVTFVIFFNLVADLTYAWLDPRIRHD
jgi:peptide/nickel transport system permease protein